MGSEAFQGNCQLWTSELYAGNCVVWLPVPEVEFGFFKRVPAASDVLLPTVLVAFPERPLSSTVPRMVCARGRSVPSEEPGDPLAAGLQVLKHVPESTRRPLDPRSGPVTAWSGCCCP